MSLIKEQEIIKQWVEKYSNDVKKWDNSKKESSYWKNRPVVGGIEEYDFSKLSEIQSCFESVWKEDKHFKEIEKILAVGTLKSCKKEETESIKVISDYVYIF